MKLLKLEYKNLFSLGAGSIDLESLGLVLVTGFSEDEGSSNGSGKSSLANKAVLWTLFGETAGGLRADAVLNRHGKKTCAGKLTFEGVDRTNYRIERKRPAKLSLFKGTTDISAHTAKDTQLLIDSLLGFDFETFVQTSVFGQGRHEHYPSLSPKQRKEVLENILPMEEADRWTEATEVAIKKLTPEIAKSASDIVASESNLSAVQRAMEMSTADGEAFEAERSVKLEQAEEKILMIEAQFQCELDGLSVAAAMHKETDVAALNNQLELIVMESGTWDKYLQDASDKKDEASRSLLAWDNKISALHKEAATLCDTTSCPACNRPFENMTYMNARLNTIADEVAESYLSLDQAKTAHSYWYSDHTKWHARIASSTIKAQGLLHEINECKGLVHAKVLIDTKRAGATAAAQERLEIAKNTENPHVALYERHALEEVEAKTALNLAGLANAKLVEELDHLKYWKQVYGRDLKLKLFEDACPFLDARTAYHLSALKNSQIHCEFSTVKRLATGATKDEFDVVVWSETGGRGFEALSGGEQQMVSFAIGLSLADLANRVGGSESGFLILDEPFTELDERNGEAVIEYLTAEVENGRDTVFLISNEPSLQGLIQNRIHVVKSRGITNVSDQ